jgi:copper(I)-binding protein
LKLFALIIGVLLVMPAQTDDTLQVVATNPIIADVARNVGGDLVTVTTTETPDADLVLINGVDDLDSDNLVAVSEGVPMLATSMGAAMHGGGAVSAAYMVIQGDDTLIAADSPAAAVVEIHQTRMENDVMRMSPVDGISIEGEAVLEPGGFHVMLINLTRDLEPGDPIPLTLSFASGAEISLEALVDDFGEVESIVEADGLTVQNAWVRPAAAYIGRLGDDAECGPCNPYVWFDVDNVIIWVENIREAFSAADPDNAARYQDQAYRYFQQLESLKQAIDSQVETVENRKLVTNHNFLAYFAVPYGFRVMVVEDVTETDAPVIFVDDPDLVTDDGQIIGLYSDNLDEDVSTYIEFMRYNVEQIITALAAE